MLVFIAINEVDDPLVNATIGQELFYWIVRVLVLAGGLWSADILVSRLFANRWANRWANPAWLRPVLLVSAIGLLPLAITELVVEPHLPIRPEYSDDDLWAYSPLLAFLSEYATILSILFPVHLLLWLIIDRKAQPESDAAEEGAAAPPAFLARAAVQRTEDVLALNAEEHYVCIHTEESTELVHYRFGDAVREMPPELGLQVHRSWWVADDAVRSATRGARRWQLQLSTGVSVPVSDSYVTAVRKKGWLKRKNRR